MQISEPVPIDLSLSSDSKHEYASVITALTDWESNLLLEWIAYFVNQRYPLKGPDHSESDGKRSWSYSSAFNANHPVRLSFEEDVGSYELRIRTVAISQESHRLLVSHALQHTRRGLKRDLIWHASVEAAPSMSDPSTGLHFMRALGHARRAQGWVALGKKAIFNFAPPPDPPPLALLAPVRADLFFRAPGVHAGPFSTGEAAALLPNITACASFCLGVPLNIFPHKKLADEKHIQAIAEVGRSKPVPQLAVEGVPVGMRVDAMSSSGAPEASRRLVRAMVSYETAMRQVTRAASVIHLVSSIEALAHPNLRAAQKLRVVHRFKHFLLQCVPDVLDAKFEHGNFAQAFPRTRNANQLAQEIYNSRSLAVHTGYFGEFHDPLGGGEGLRVMLVADIARSAIMRFAEQPFSSLVGHPRLDPVISFPLSHDRFAALERRAGKKPVPDYVMALVASDLNGTSGQRD